MTNVVGQSEYYAEIFIYLPVGMQYTMQNAEFIQYLNSSWSVNVSS